MSQTVVPRAAVLLLSMACVASGAAAGSDKGNGPGKHDLSPNQFKKTCKAAAQADGFSVGDFGDVKFDEARKHWVIKVNLQGKGEKFRGRCEWDGSSAPRLTEWHSGHDIMPRKYTRDDARKACKAAAMARGFNVGDFGDTELSNKTGLWVARLMVQKPGQEKYKATCRWDGRRTAEIE